MFKALLELFFILPSLLFLLLPKVHAGCDETFKQNAKPNATSPIESWSGYRQNVEDLIEAYTKILVPNQNPFQLAVKGHIVDKIFFELMHIKPLNSSLRMSPLALINQALNQSFVNKDSFDKDAVEWVIKESIDRITTKTGTKLELQSNLKALQYTLEYLDRFSFNIAVAESRAETKPEDANNVSKETKANQKSSKLPSTPKKYKPHTKDVSNKSDGSQQEIIRFAETDFITQYFIQRYYHNLSRHSEFSFQEGKLPGPNQHLPKYQSSERNITFRPQGNRSLELFLPSGLIPFQSKDPRGQVSKNEYGVYILSLAADVEEITLPLFEEKNLDLSQHALEILTRPLGFSIEEWPAELRKDIFDVFKPGRQEANTLEIASALTKHLRSKYKYSVDKLPELDPVDALRRGAFQCDMAAFAMVGILRDHYHIPSRVVGGYRAKLYKSGSNHRSYLIIPDEAHSWIQVYFRGRWHDFDGTPWEKTRKEDNSNQSDYRDVPNLEGNTSENNQIPKNELTTDAEKEQANHFDLLKQNTESRMREVAQQKENENQRLKEQEQQTIDEYFQNELANKELKVGSIVLDPKLEHNTIRERMFRNLLKFILDPSLEGLKTQNFLNQTRSIFNQVNSETLKQLLQEALRVHEKDHPPIDVWIKELSYLAFEQDLKTTYSELNRIQSALNIFSKTLDPNGNIRYPTELLLKLNTIKQEFKKLSHANSEHIGLAKQFMDDLPSVLQLHLRQLYHINSIGNNPETISLAQDLQRGKLNDLRLIALLTPLTDFVLSSTPSPEFKKRKVWERNFKKPIGFDLLPFQKFSDIYRSYLAQPEKSLVENIADGTAYVFAERKTANVPDHDGEDGNSRVTVVLFDTSASMAGVPEKFQAALIAAFSSRALSDLSSLGEARHKVVLIPFDHEPKEAIYVRSTSEALNLLQNYRSLLKNSGGGTDIQKALIGALKAIAEAEEQNDRALSAANIILLSDGQSDVDVNRIAHERSKISRETPIQTMFIAIDQTNLDLVKLVSDSENLGFEKSFYREFPNSHILKLIEESTHKINVDDFFYTESDPSRLPGRVKSDLQKLRLLAGNYLNELQSQTRYVHPEIHNKKIEGLFKKIPISQQKGKEEETTILERSIVGARRVLMNSVFQDQILREKSIHEIMEHFETLTGRKLESLSGIELGHLQHFINSRGPDDRKVFK